MFAPSFSLPDEARKIEGADLSGATGTDRSRSGEIASSWHVLTDGEKTLNGLARKAREMYEMRARRGKYFPETALSEAAWDMLLALFADTVEGRPTSTKSIGISGGVPVSTCLAILGRLEEDGLIVRKPDVKDRRVTRVVISPAGLLSMRDYLLNEIEGRR